jgi:hypothetical protein
METTKAIRAMICRHHGGMEQATDDQIMKVWSALTAATQEAYLEQEPRTHEPKKPGTQD